MMVEREVIDRGENKSERSERYSNIPDRSSERISQRTSIQDKIAAYEKNLYAKPFPTYERPNLDITEKTIHLPPKHGVKIAVLHVETGEQNLILEVLRQTDPAFLVTEFMKKHNM